ncbi:nitric oxide synthase oxygenase [Cytophagaceae bacterium DM2B3-1]|uniref:Nitric oxide synthase oxygenase n=1 Tax=Xanthocytophaga flava TaxID=3048013 RepID=A0ABT7CSW6_9BACT|nr:nitric oxide synthase oxygenase [Xanthocytophaga flavus]MDJ1496766.1 nitric oxide synthase oxygenase [Xanthocytophaga flavus]
MNPDYLKQEAIEFLTQTYTELALEADLPTRINQVIDEINISGTYIHTFEELDYGAKLAWRNSNRCIGRLYWKSLKVRDMRHIQTEEDIFTALLEHLDYATNDGNIRSVISIFSPKHPSLTAGIRILNHQLVRYAGYYSTDTHTYIGDPAQYEFTKKCQQLGWQSSHTHFDILPLLIQLPHGEARMFTIPSEKIKEVTLSHPDYEWFTDLQLRWYAVPVISNMKLEIGGIEYTAAPFNGWYMGTEIGARNLGDTQRYNLLPMIAHKMGLSTSANHTLWKDRALVELNIAVLHSYQQAGVKIVDHHTASDQFITHTSLETKNQREVVADWAWIVPPISGSATEVFHRAWKNTMCKPNFLTQDDTLFTSAKTCPRESSY